MIRTVGVALAIFVVFVVVLGVLGKGVGAPELLVWIVLLVATEVVVLRRMRRRTTG